MNRLLIFCIVFNCAYAMEETNHIRPAEKPVLKVPFSDLPQLSTTDLYLKPLQLTDYIELFFNLYSDREVTENLLFHPHSGSLATKSLVKRLIKRRSKNKPSPWVIKKKKNKQIIGIAGFDQYFPHNHTATIVMLLKPEYWGKGYMRQAVRQIIEFGFDHMNLNAIEWKARADDKTIQSAYKKYGKPYGVRRGRTAKEDCYFKGAFYNTTTYRITQQEFDDARHKIAMAAEEQRLSAKRTQEADLDEDDPDDTADMD